MKMEPYQFHSGLNDIRMQQNDHPGGDQRSWNMMSYLTLSYLIVVYYPLIIHGLVKNPQDFDDFPSDSKKPTSMASSEISQLHMFDHRKVLYCILLYHILPISEGPRAQTSFWEFPEVHLKGHPNTWSRACIYNPTWNFTTKEASVFGNSLEKSEAIAWIRALEQSAPRYVHDISFKRPGEKTHHTPKGYTNISLLTLRRI